MPEFKKGSTFRADLHVHPFPYGGNDTVEQSMQRVIGLPYILNLVGYCGYNKLHPRLVSKAREEADRHGRFAKAVAEVATTQGHITISPKEDDDGQIERCASAIRKFREKRPTPYDLIASMYEQFGAFAIVDHGNPQGRFAPNIEGMVPVEIRDLVHLLRDNNIRAAVGIELDNFIVDQLIGTARHERHQGLIEVADELARDGLGVGKVGGSDGGLVGAAYTAFTLDRDLKNVSDLHGAVESAIYNNQTRSVLASPIKDFFPVGWLEILQIGLDHKLPRIQERMHEGTYPARWFAKRVNLVDLYDQHVKKISSDHFEWRRELERMKNLAFSDAYHQQLVFSDISPMVVPQSGTKLALTV